MRFDKIIRDAVHLDIVFSEKFFALIDTKEFQRLNRIRQLSCEHMVFPTATHSRLAHSLGTYYVMYRLIDHFSDILEELGHKVKEQDKELALCAALLHDIGHGPFSHTFEKLFQLKEHEKWAIDILNSKDTEINKVIRKNFGEEFLERLTDIISKDYSHKANDGIFSIISMLVSSQIDADRMDYLLRDAYFTSVTNGIYDIKRLIRAFGAEMTEDGNFRIFIHEKYMATLEEYILARYYMHKEVYQHSIKKQMEGILKKIFKRAIFLHQSKQNIEVSPVMKKLFEGRDITPLEYHEIDDTTLLYHISIWQQNEDVILSFLCKSFTNRKKFKKYTFQIGDEDKLKILKEKIKKALNNEKYPNDEMNFKDEYFYFEDDVEIKIYENKKENIWIKKRDGSLVDLSKASVIINESSLSNTSDSIKRVYISYELFEKIYGKKLEL